MVIIFILEHDDNRNTSNENVYCELPADATAIAAIASSLALGSTRFNYISDSGGTRGVPPISRNLCKFLLQKNLVSYLPSQEVT